MRWPLRLQIMLPMAAVMLVAVAAVGGLGALLAVRATQARINAQVAGVTQLLEQSNFPLTDAVLRQMKALSGAEMVLVDASGNTLATSGLPREYDPSLATVPLSSDKPIRLGDHIWVRDDGFLHTTLNLGHRRGNGQSGTLHIFYPEHEYRRAWQLAVFPSIVLVTLALPVVMLLAALTGTRITRRMIRLQAQVDRIAEGDFREVVETDRNDEIRALGIAVNRMATMLAAYEQQVRHTERMRTLATLGGGVAHQLRNSATGCGMALELHAEECVSGRASESLQVAKRQLRLMEEYIQRFLQLGKPADEYRTDVLRLATLIDEVLPLVQPAARHSGIDLQWNNTAAIDSNIEGDASALSQLLINLLLNAIEAAASAQATSGTTGRVVVGLAHRPEGRIALTIADSGCGPAEGVRPQLFQPFVSEKADGIGLGLSVAADVAARHGGRITWERAVDMTQFTVDFPLAQPEVQCA